MFGARAVFDVQRLAFGAADLQKERGQCPTLGELRTADPSLPATDIWRCEFRLVRSDRTFQVESAGVDGNFDTADDVHSDPMPLVVTTTSSEVQPHR